MRWLLPVGGASRALDLAAGTGALSSVLIPLVGDVVALDLDPRMLAVARRRVPGLRRAVASAEALPVADASVDLVGVSSAWHWFDPDLALAEAARVLRPAGVLGLLWGGPDRRVPWVGEMLSGGRPGGDPGLSPDGGRRGHDAPVPPPGVAFTPAETRTFAATVRYAAADLPGLAASYSSVITLPDAEGRADNARVRAMLGTHPELAGRDEVELPLSCRAVRLTRLD